MKNTRKAAAVWLAMSLAISTAFGNTAWGEIRPDTGNNRCVHVHTAECYKDADETATPSQIGKEPTECTHICSVESGCIRDTEKENNENADTLVLLLPIQARMILRKSKLEKKPQTGRILLVIQMKIKT